MPIELKSLQSGTPVLVSFDVSLSVPYAEPLGRLFTPKNEEIVDGEKQIFEAYGYDPHRPGNTPTPFWGDHYIKTPTLWRTIKERVNSEVFLPLFSNGAVPAVLAITRIQNIGKFICLAYHRHLVEAYAAVWALTDAMRRHYRGKPASSWRIASADLTRIVGLAGTESNSVRTTPLYQTLDFAQLVRELELSGLSPHYEPIRDRLQSVASEMFEVITSEYVRARSGFSVRRSVWIPQLKAEVDMYAVQDLANKISIVIGSNKLRVSSNRPILPKEIEQLSRRIEKTKEHENAHASGVGKSLAVSGAFFTNTATLPEEVGRYARDLEVEVFCVHLPGQWLERPARKQLNESDIEFIGGDTHGPLRPLLVRSRK